MATDTNEGTANSPVEKRYLIEVDYTADSEQMIQIVSMFSAIIKQRTPKATLRKFRSLCRKNGVFGKIPAVTCTEI